MAPVMMRVAWFYTLLTRSVLDLAVVPHAVMPYSSTGLTLPVYSLLRVTVSAPHVVPANFFMGASRTLALASAFSVCCFQVSYLLKVTPRYLGGVDLSKQNLAVDMQGGLLFLCLKTEDGVGGLPGIDSYKPPFCPTFQGVQRLL